MLTYCHCVTSDVDVGTRQSTEDTDSLPTGPAAYKF